MALLIVYVAIPVCLTVTENYNVAKIYLIGVSITILCPLFFIIRKDISSVKFGILELKLREKIQEAENTILYLRLLSVKVSETLIDFLALHKRPASFITFPSVIERIEEIENVLKEIGISNDELKAVKKSWDDTVVYNYKNRLLNKILKKGSEELKERARDLIESEEYPEANVIKKLLLEMHPLDEDEQTMLDEYNHFLKTKKIINSARFQ